jgi:hypothetical protein
MDIEGKFYLGKFFDVKTKALKPDPLLYSLEDLTTHAVILGMTGSGKTGLCIDLLEEAALNRIPALMIDPKGDITNLLLQFPNLLPEDFKPWVNPDEARRQSKTLEQVSEETAALWRKGLGDWSITPERIAALKEAVDFAVYTPGSDAGISINILASLKAPEIPWDANREMLREKISGTATALLGLVGLEDIDPVRSREHILISNIFEDHWKHGLDLNLGELIMQIQSPPFQKLGVFDVNTFFPEKDRFELAMLMNNILASPSFQTWIVGQPLDIKELMFTPEGKPRQCVFYIAHLNDTERMFFVTLLYSAVESWMRAQSGTTTLRAIVYFDEIYGYIPPVRNPPAKLVMLRMLKQARAFGVGQVLVTQNPVDLDYKALSNAGTWFIGKLQTERDKQRLLDGLDGALGGLDRETYDRLIAGLNKRVFLMHNVHEKEPMLFQTRWAMSYLAGPLTRTQIPALNQLAGVTAAEEPTAPAAKPVSVAAAAVADTQPVRPTRPVAATASAAAITSTTRQPVPAGVEEFFLPVNLSPQQACEMAGRPCPPEGTTPRVIYRPSLLAQVTVRYLNRKYNLDYEKVCAVLVTEVDRRAVVRWEDFPAMPIDARRLADPPAAKAGFAPLDPPYSDLRTLKNLERDYQDYVYRTSEAVVRYNEGLQVYAGQQTPQAEFRKQCATVATERRDQEAEKLSASYENKIDALQIKLDKAEKELETQQDQLSHRRMDEWGTHADNLARLILPRKKVKISASQTKSRMTSQAKSEVKEAEALVNSLKKQIAELQQEKADALAEVTTRWTKLANQVAELKVTPLKKDILPDHFGVAWYPYYVYESDGQAVDLPGYGPV